MSTRQKILDMRGNDKLVDSYRTIRANIEKGVLNRGWGLMILGGRLNEFCRTKFKAKDKVLTPEVLNAIMDEVEVTHFGANFWGPDNDLFKRVMKHGIELLKAHGEDETAQQWQLKLERNLNFKVVKP